MYSLSVKATDGLSGSLELTHQEDKWQIISVRGLNPPESNINIMRLAGQDGGRFNSQYIETRNIVIQLQLNGDAEANRYEIYKYFPQHRPVEIYYNNGARNVYCKGYVETVECNPFSFPVVMQISVICPDPCWYDQLISSVTGRAPEIENESTELALGLKMHIIMAASASYVTVATGNAINTRMKITYPFESGDIIDINTNDGEKSVKLTRGDQINPTIINLFPYLSDDSEFIQVPKSPYIGGLASSLQIHYRGETYDIRISNSTTTSYQPRYLGV